VAIALFTIATLFPQMGAHRKGIHESEQAKIIAMEVLEGLQMWSAIAADDTSSIDYDICDENFPPYVVSLWDDFTTEWGTPKTIGAAAYKVEWDLCTQPGSSLFKTAKVTVSWPKSGKTHNIEVTGVIR